jgi:hydrogenase expression/formation protein HypD
MKYIEEYRDPGIIGALAEKIRKTVRGTYNFMEVCGGHTAAIRRFGLPSLLPSGINLISGPGCPVCVTSLEFIDRLIAYSRLPDTVIATFGDLLRIPGTDSSLENERSSGADIRVVYSGLDALEIARTNRGINVIFPGIGFETTAPGNAVTLKQAAKEKLDNFLFVSAHKIMPPAMEAVAGSGSVIDGFICPGHVAAITGSEIFSFLPSRFGLGCVVSGFEPADLLQSILMLIKQKNSGSPAVEIQYSRAVTKHGNLIAKTNLEEVFETCDSVWRGFGLIPGSGLRLKESFRHFDASYRIKVEIKPSQEIKGCICGDVLRGLKKPSSCRLFRKQCTPDHPLGACMVSAEGTCNTYYRYS